MSEKTGALNQLGVAADPRTADFDRSADADIQPDVNATLGNFNAVRSMVHVARLR